MAKKINTILLLGGYGFIGTNLMKWVEKQHLPYDFVVFDRLPYHPKGIKFSCIKKSYGGDFGDSTMLSTIIKDNNIDIVIHAISTVVPLQKENARFDIESNLIPTISLVEAMLEQNVRNIVFLSSGGAIYGDSSLCGRHIESEDVFPKSSYGVVKLAIEKFLFHYNKVHGLNPMILRISNPYGKYHYSQKQGIINIALRAALSKETFTVWGNGSVVKDYVFVEDVCSALFKLLEKQAYGQIFNLASGELWSVNDILNLIHEAYPNFKWEYTTANVNDVSRVELNTDKLHDTIDIKFSSLKDNLMKCECE